MAAPRIPRRKKNPAAQMFTGAQIAPSAPVQPQTMFAGPIQAMSQRGTDFVPGASQAQRPFDWASLAQGLGMGLLTGKNWGEGVGQGLMYARQFGQQNAESERQAKRDEMEATRFDFEKQKYQTELDKAAEAAAQREKLSPVLAGMFGTALDQDPSNDIPGLTPQIAQIGMAMPVDKQFELLSPFLQGPEPAKAPTVTGGMFWNEKTQAFEPVPGWLEQQAAIAAAGRAPQQPPAPPEALRLMQAAGIDPSSPEGQDLIRQKLAGGSQPSPSDRAKRALEAGLQPGTPEYNNFILSSDVPDPSKPENILRDEFNTLTKDFRTVQDAYSKIQATSDTGAGDMSMLYSYVKLLDPGSVVRESEFATAAASGSFGEQVQGAVQRVLTGERLPDSLRNAFKAEAQAVFNAQKSGYDRLKKSYEGLATRSGANPQNVIVDYAEPAQITPGPSTPGAGGYDEKRGNQSPYQQKYGITPRTP